MFDSVVNTCYVLHQTHSKFWHIQHSVFSRICRNIQSYSALLRHIHAYWDIIQAYSSLFSTLCNPRIFTTLLYIYWAYLNLYETDIFRTLAEGIIQSYSELCATLAYAETWNTQSWNIQNPSIIAWRTHIQDSIMLTKMYKYSELRHT